MLHIGCHHESGEIAAKESSPRLEIVTEKGSNMKVRPCCFSNSAVADCAGVSSDGYVGFVRPSGSDDRELGRILSSDHGRSGRMCGQRLRQHAARKTVQWGNWGDFQKLGQTVIGNPSLYKFGQRRVLYIVVGVNNKVTSIVGP